MLSKICSYRHRTIKSEINIVPLLDVLLVLLLVFMATLPSFMEDLEVQLPDVSNSKLISNNNPIVIIQIADVSHYNVVIGHNRMKLLLEQMLSVVYHQISNNPKTVFLIGAAKNIHYDEIIKVIDLLHKGGVKSVGLMTRPI